MASLSREPIEGDSSKDSAAAGSFLSRQTLRVSEGDPRGSCRVQALGLALSCRSPGLLEVRPPTSTAVTLMSSEPLRWWPFQLPWGHCCPRGLAASG